MPGPRVGLQRIPPKAIQLGFWATFGVVVAMAFVGSSMTRYRYSPDLSAITYSSLLQGFGVLAVATALGLALRKHLLDVDIRSVEDRTLEALSRDLGWHGLRWSGDLEERIRTLPPTMTAVGQAAAPSPAPQAPAYQAQAPLPVPPAPQTGDDPEALDQELDSLLDAIMVEEERKPSGAASRAAQKEVEELEQMQLVARAPPPAPPTEVGPPPETVQVEAATFIAAVDERTGLVTRRRELYALMSGPLAQMGVLVAVSYYALPLATGSLARDAFLNTALLFMSTYGAVVALAHTALSALRIVAA